ncbi:DEAD/DEAH box helicase [Corallococcus macrosporus]|uniref:DEAD/DEAH box helicase n=1 Tax=Corallococcus macrosporus DSM 14697 TaxID=1189310 RepID=A0A250JYK6_9BACT|nr:DEAD/DEAH box helicase [Corallococcus macrosporus]ATB48421.1 hypothetical protein MYMAC_004048 [Corallococcus macrosporus DSM 14697]
MFSEKELAACTETEWFREDFSRLSYFLTSLRIKGMAEDQQSPKPGLGRLSRFSEAVLASAAQWQLTESRIASRLCTLAGDIEMASAKLSQQQQRAVETALHYLKAAILYDLGRQPGPAASAGMNEHLALDIRNYFARDKESCWGTIGASRQPNTSPPPAEIDDESTQPSIMIQAAISEVMLAYGTALQDPSQDAFMPLSNALAFLQQVSTSFFTGLNGGDLESLSKSLELRRGASTVLTLEARSALSRPELKVLGMPVDLWPSQQAAINAGVLSDSIRGFGLAAPTGTGKTALMRILLADFLKRNEGARAIYVAPSRALAAQVTKDLQNCLGPIGISVAGLGASLTIFEAVPTELDAARVLVFTPEKADLILRIGKPAIKSIGLAVIDEAHHIEDGTRGILLEFYLWRLKSILGSKCRVVQLSAVTPNIKDLTGWLDPSETSEAITVEWRAAPLRIGTFECRTDRSGILNFGESEMHQVLAPGECPEDPIQGIAALASRLSKAGVVLVLATSPGRSEALADEICKLRQEHMQSGVSAERLDARLEREMHADVPLRSHFRKRVAYHHARLPPRVRSAVEAAISDRLVDIVCATTTLAEGVNFPFSTVIVESLVADNYEISPRVLWNIAGRAGRFGVDAEGYCILFRPSAWKHRLSEFSFDQYFPEKLRDMPPVRSALGTAMSQLRQAVNKGGLNLESLNQIDLSALSKESTEISERGLKRIRGLINMLRVGYVHAKVSGAIKREGDWAQQLEHGMFASQAMNEEDRAFCGTVAKQQQKLVGATLERNTELLQIAARIGWSLESQSELMKWIRSCKDFQLRNFGVIVVGGQIKNPSKLGYLLGPASKHMAEFEGDKLGGMTAFISSTWLEGLPLTIIRDRQDKEKSWSRLIKIIYARVIYLLPWALFGIDELVQYEARTRGAKVGSGIRDLSVLASEGVPSFDALRLVLELDIERVDATRLAAQYQRGRKKTDVLGWLRRQQWRDIVSIVREPDGRRLDPDLRSVYERLQASSD